MRLEALTNEHVDRLDDYGISGLSLDDALLLRYSKGETILHQGMPMEYVLILVSGKAKVYSTTATGKDILIAYYDSFGVIGDVELMTSSLIASTTGIALTEFICIGLPYSKYSNTLKNNLSFLRLIGRELSLKLLQSSQKGIITTLNSVEQRLCAFIIQNSTDGVFSETLTEVASIIGASYRHMLRVFKKLCVDGVLKKGQRQYFIVNEKELYNRAPDFYFE